MTTTTAINPLMDLCSSPRIDLMMAISHYRKDAVANWAEAVLPENKTYWAERIASINDAALALRNLTD